MGTIRIGSRAQTHAGTMLLTRDVRRRVHGLLLMAWDAWFVTMGGMRLQRRYARLNASHTASGISVWYDGIGTAGSFSTMACMAV